MSVNRFDGKYAHCSGGIMICRCGGDTCFCGLDGQACLGCDKCDGPDDEDAPESPR